MKLQEYMRRNAGEYTFAEDSRPVTLAQLDDEWAQEEIEVYLLGYDAGGHCKTHLYSRSHHRHIMTHVSEVELEITTLTDTRQPILR